MKKINDEITVLSQLKTDCKTIESISQYRYANYLKIIKSLNVVITQIKSALIFEDEKGADFLIGFCSFFDTKLNKIMSDYMEKKILIISTSAVAKTYKAQFPNCTFITINTRKLKSLNTKAEEEVVMSQINNFLINNGVKKAVVYSCGKVNMYHKGTVNHMVFMTNVKQVSLLKLGIYEAFILFLSAIALNEYSNNNSAIKKIDELISEKKSEKRKILAKRSLVFHVSNSNKN